MSDIHVRATAKGTTPYAICPANSTQSVWKLDQLNLHCEVTFTDVATVRVYSMSHESTKYDVVVIAATLATVNGVLNDLVWVPETPISFSGKDRAVIVFEGVSSGMSWAYDAAVQA